MDRHAAAETSRRVGIMPMVAFCVFTALALFCGLLDDGGRQAVLPDYPVVADGHAPHGTAVDPKRPLTAAEWRAGKATAPLDDGKSKLFLLSSGPLLVFGSAQPPPGPAAVHPDATAASHDYRARAPPASAYRLHIGVAV